MQRVHVDLIDVRTFLTVDLNVHEKFVHYGRSGLIVEAFVRHDVAPMAGRVADR